MVDFSHPSVWHVRWSVVRAGLWSPDRRGTTMSLLMFGARLGAAALVSLTLGFGPSYGQGGPAAHSWLDPALLAAAKAEGSLTVYSSTNEQEGLPLFKLFEDATGIKVQYVRGSDAVLTSRMTIEFRANQKSYDIVHMTTINKLPPQLLEVYEPAEAKNILPEARDPGK